MRRVAVALGILLTARIAAAEPVDGAAARAAPAFAPEAAAASSAPPSSDADHAASASPSPDPRPAALVDERRVVALALADHPAVQAAVEAKRAADAAYDAAQGARIPDVNVAARYARLSSIPARYRSFDGFTFPQLLDQLGVRAQLSVPLTDAFLGLAAAARAAGKESEARELEVVNARAQVAYEARVAFLQYWSMTLALENAEELVRAAESNAVDQRNREAAGTVAHNDVLEFEVALDAAVMTRHAAEADLVAAEAALRAFLPSLAGQRLKVAAELDQGERAPRPPAPVASPPRLASIEAQGRAAEARSDAASLARLPTLAAYAAGDVSAPSPRVFVMNRLVAIPTWEAGVRLEWSLSQLMVGNARATQARSEQAILAARLADAKRRLDAERAGAVGTLNLTHARVQRARERVERATALAKARRGELDAGTVLPLNVVVAETDLARAKNEHVVAAVAQALSMAKVDFVDGRTTPSDRGTR
ncbi:MAG: TolC family protein [Labilithrix sp.]|nr:TolC family protein [Labilithrix sp.]